MSRVSRVARVDRLGPIRFDRHRPAHADLDSNETGIVARLTVDGYLRVEGRISGCGVYSYEDAEGEEWGELRTPEDVFDDESLTSFSMSPVTDDHPPEMLSSANVREYQCGQLGSRQRPDGDFVLSDMLITSPELIEKIKSGKCELSCGYTTVLVPEEGVLDGAAYSYRQTEIRGNHLSVVDVARGGPMCRLILDSKGAISSKGDSRMKIGKDAKAPQQKVPAKKDASVSIGGVDMDVPDEVAAELARLQTLVAELQAASGGDAEEETVIETDEPGVEPAEETEVMASKDSASKTRNQSAKPSASSDKDKARIDALEASLKAEREGSAARIDARVNLVTRAREILGKDAKTDGFSDIALMRQVVTKVTPAMKAKVDAGSLDYVQAAYECALDAFASRVDSSDELAQVVFEAHRSAQHGDAELDIDALYAKHVDGRSKGYRAQKEAV